MPFQKDPSKRFPFAEKIISGKEQRDEISVVENKNFFTFNENSGSVVNIVLPLAKEEFATFEPHNALAWSLVSFPSAVINPIIIKSLTFAMFPATAKAPDEFVQK